MSPGAVDRGWPFQIAGRSRDAEALGYIASSGAHSSLCWRRHTVVDGAVGYQVFCFADPDQAARFKGFIGGEDFDPRDRWGGKWVRGRGAARDAKQRRTGW
jgi:hypothetical protein